MMPETVIERRWGTDIVREILGGHPCQVYRDRPRALSDLLIDAQRWDDRVLLVQGERRLTGKDHLAAVARVAETLRQRGVRPGDTVLLQGFNHIEWVVAFWALQCIGATVALGNAWWSELETQSALHLTRPRLLIRERMPEATLRVSCDTLLFSELRGIVDAGEDVALRVDPVAEEACAVVIFSSGTTGQAKGAMMSHRAVIANIHNLLRMTGRLPDDLDDTHPGTVNLVTMPLFHQGGMQISLMTLLTGGRIVFLRGRFDPVEVLQLMQDEKVRAWGSVPTMVSRVVMHPEFASFDTSSVASIQMGGAPIPYELRAQVKACFPASGKRVGSMYGLTETGVVATGVSADVEGRPGCVGRPLPAAEIRIAAPNAEGVGEIQVRSASATTGYLGDPTPIGDAEGWIASGDLGRFDDEGRLYVVGRAKDMIIRGGENVASAHVERCLRTHPAVAEAAVVPLPHADLGEEVAAVVVFRPGAQATADALREHALAHLAKFEVPSRWWLRRDALPTNATGKVLKRQLTDEWPEEA
ncbi:MAG: AMP-binding protein [Pigmentiphaga sp.]|nr:AMP-binding protein [Pigmentiphaga sp.]